MIVGKHIGLRAIENDDLEKLREWRNTPNLRKFFRETSEISKINQEAWFKSIN